MLRLDRRADALEIRGERGQDLEAALDRGDACMLGLHRGADPLEVVGDLIESGKRVGHHLLESR